MPSQTCKRSRVLDRRYVTDQCSSVVAGPLQARPILIQAQATLISLPSNHTEERIIRKQEGTCPTVAAAALQMPYTMPSEVAWCAATPYFPRASFLRTASTSAQESRIHRLQYTCRQACIVYLSREINLTPHSSHVSAVEAALADTCE